jgi:hypothetical protein
MFDELKIDSSIFREAIDKKLFQGPEHERPWRVLQEQAPGGEISWEIEVKDKDGSTRQFPFPDGELATVLAWLERNKGSLENG